MLAEYLGLLVILAAAIALAVVMLGVQSWLAPSRRFAAKQEPFAGGERPIASPRRRFSVEFQLVAILFIVFEVAAVFFHPWGATFREVGWPGFVAMGLFTLPLLVGLAYEWAKGAFDW